MPNIENPILNSPFVEPNRHFQFDDHDITDTIIPSRRPSFYFIPIAKTKKKGKQLVLDKDWVAEREEENFFINRVRDRVRMWREGGYKGVTRTTARLLEYWTDESRDKRLFFCQIEALETSIYITEVATNYDDDWIEKKLGEYNTAANPLLHRMALKMATGSGKTVVMAMLIAWHTLNKKANQKDARFSDSFLIVTPGITIRDRLQVLLPQSAENYYKARDIVPPHQFNDLLHAQILITNYHAFILREKQQAPKLTKNILNPTNQPSVFTEQPEDMVRRVCGPFAKKKNIVVLNDEAHHCYRNKPLDPDEMKELSTEDRKDAEEANKQGKIWISGLEAIQKKMGVKVVYDLSATPFFLSGSGYKEGLLFPWVVSDFSLIDAIEAGIVKIPRVPIADNSMTGEAPTYRDLWEQLKDSNPPLPKATKSAKAGRAVVEPQLPAKLQGALHSLYENYQKSYDHWAADTVARDRGRTPPVFIVVCNNTAVSKMVFDYIGGWEKPLTEPWHGRPARESSGQDMGETPMPLSVPVPGALPLFSNVVDGRWSHRPTTILVDSQQLESGEAMSDDFKKLAAVEIDEFKHELRQRFPGRDVSQIADEDLLREVMNTVGKAGKLGENVKCVVSVSMLTEGWDANSVTHILGVRAFGTQLLCEQVVGRGLRRMSYTVGANGHFTPEYAEVYGVPFSFISSKGTANPDPPQPTTRVRALEDRIHCEIQFPRVQGYYHEIADAELEYRFNKDTQLALSTRDVPTITENSPIVGQSSVHSLDELRGHRIQEVVFRIAKLTLEKYFRGDGTFPKRGEPPHQWNNEVQAWRFPQLLDITRHWLAECLTCQDNTFPQLLLLFELAHDAADKIYAAIMQGAEAQKTLLPRLQPVDPIGSTRWVDFDTARPVFLSSPDKCHISHVVADTDSWEQKMAQTLEDMPEVVRYVKNQNLDFTIPYTLNGAERRYIPDFIACLDDGNGPDDLLNLIVEVSGQPKKDKAAKTATARTLWVPAVNNAGSFGRWDFLEVTDPWDAARTIRGHLSGQLFAPASK